MGSMLDTDQLRCVSSSSTVAPLIAVALGPARHEIV
jgi:hypothetical protein